MATFVCQQPWPSSFPQPLGSKFQLKIATKVEQEGSDIWFEKDSSYFLTKKYDPKDWDPVQDIIEVWFDSGSTHAFVLEQRDDLKWPADLYLEGSDQHRGWFHTCFVLMCSV